jgi:hypothetical protein
MDFGVLHYGIPLLVFITIIITLLVIVLLKSWINHYFLQISLRRSIKDIGAINFTVGIPIFFGILILIGPLIGNRVYPYLGSSSHSYTILEFFFISLRFWGTLCVILIIVDGIILESEEKSSTHQTIWIASILGNFFGYLFLSIITTLIYQYLQIPK